VSGTRCKPFLFNPFEFFGHTGSVTLELRAIERVRIYYGKVCRETEKHTLIRKSDA
jgi:hypothetical protein